MTDIVNRKVDYVDQHRSEFLDQLMHFLRIPSVSTKSDHKNDVAAAADYVANHLKKQVGIETVEICPTAGHPIVYAEWLGAGPTAPTILIYGHYDVQPPEPLELWESGPFEPVVKEGRIIARGATDDKGQVFAHLKGLEAHLKTDGKLPVNVKLVIEGEEEIGSPHLEPWIAQHAERLACDAVVISDTSMFAPNVPAITTGLRGLVYFQVEIDGPSHDLHSGAFGGAIANPVQVLCTMLASLKDELGRVAIPGFYDDVRDLPADLRHDWGVLPFDEQRFLQTTGAITIDGEDGFTTLERLWARPTLEINGLLAGFTGEGAKTVLPAKAMAKFSCRLVPDQDPAKIEDLIETHFEKICPPTVKMTFSRLHGGPPALIDHHHPAVQAAGRALKLGFGAEPVFIREGGSIPIVATFTKKLDAPVLLVGFGLNDDRAHSPNEKFDLRCFYGGILTSVHLWDELATLTPKQSH